MTIFHKFPVPSSRLFVWVLTPSSKIKQEWMEAFHTQSFEQEMIDVFSELGVPWKRQSVSLENMHDVVEKIAVSTPELIPVVLNYCDGLDEIDECPGVSLIKLLEAKGIIFVGADSIFYSFNTNKISLKHALSEARIATAPYEVIYDFNNVEGVCDRLGTPLIVKPAVLSGGSYGLSLNSVVYSDEQIGAQVKCLIEKNHGGMLLSSDSIFVESFINGSEFTVFVIGSYQQPEKIKIYPPLEIIFNTDLPETEQFLSHDRYWGKDEGKTSWKREKPFIRHKIVNPELRERLCDLAKGAYCAVSGNGYGRVDIRMDKLSKELFVLEVNANCAISSKPFSTFSDPLETPVGTILHLAGVPFAQLMSEIITEAFARCYIKSSPLNKNESKLVSQRTE